jgi:hypothetical protein
MRYLIQVRFAGAEAVIAALSADERAMVTAEFEAVRRLPGVLDANRLDAPDTATTVTVDDGRSQLRAGPPVAAGAELSGYYVLEAPGLDAATAFASRIPVARMGGSVEVRPLREA